jgi:archaellum component FlaF (FlaF/FlaG flagellin family)
MLKRGRAVSEVVASLVILLVVSILGTSLYSFSLTVMRSEQENFVLQSKTEASRAQERLKVVYVGWSRSDDTLNLTMLNYGWIDIDVAEVYVNGERVTSYSEGLGAKIHTLRLAGLSFTSPVTVFPDNLYQFVIVSERGVSHVYRWES